MLENVSGFLTSHGGKDVAQTVKVLSELGFVIDIIELDAALFTPQSRPRVFLIAVEEAIATRLMHVKKLITFSTHGGRSLMNSRSFAQLS